MAGAGFDCDGFSVNGFELQRNEGDEGLIEFNRDPAVAGPGFAVGETG